MDTTDHHNTGNGQGDVITLLIRDYLEHLRREGRSPKSLQTYGNALGCFADFVGPQHRIQDVTHAELEAYRLALSQRDFAPASLELYLRTVRQFFAWLEATQQLFLNPATHLVIPKPPRKLLPVPTEEEIDRLLSQPNTATACGVRDRAILETAYSTGARREELCSLQLADVDLAQNTLRVLGKGQRQRMVPLGKEARHWLGRYLKETRPQLLKEKKPALWINSRGRPLGYFALEQMILRHARKAKLATPLTPHALRRACATHMLRRGAHPVELQLLLGHATLKTLSQYLRLTITELKATHAQSNPGR